jgi:hypothetical protein
LFDLGAKSLEYQGYQQIMIMTGKYQGVLQVYIEGIL